MMFTPKLFNLKVNTLVATPHRSSYTGYPFLIQIISSLISTYFHAVYLGHEYYNEHGRDT